MLSLCQALSFLVIFKVTNGGQELPVFDTSNLRLIHSLFSTDVDSYPISMKTVCSDDSAFTASSSTIASIVDAYNAAPFATAVIGSVLVSILSVI